MRVDQVNVEDRRALARFVRLERELLGHHPLYVAPFDADVRKQLSGKSASSIDVGQALFLLSGNGDRDQPLGRLVAYVNRRWQTHHGESGGFIGNLAFSDALDVASVRELFEAAEAWLRRMNVSRVIAPVNGVVQNGASLLTADFDLEPMFPQPWHPPGWTALIEGSGYSPRYPITIMIYDVDFSSETYRTVSSRALDTARCHVRPVNKKKWKEEIAPLTDLHNVGLADEWEFSPATVDELLEAFGPLKTIANPNTILFAEVDAYPAGFVIGSPDLTPLIRSFNGRLGPLKILKLLREGKRPKRRGLILVAVDPEHRGKHIGQTLCATLFRYYESIGLKSAPYYPVNERNAASRRLAESFGGIGRTAYTVYDKTL